MWSVVIPAMQLTKTGSWCDDESHRNPAATAQQGCNECLILWTPNLTRLRRERESHVFQSDLAGLPGLPDVNRGLSPFSVRLSWIGQASVQVKCPLHGQIISIIVLPVRRYLLVIQFRIVVIRNKLYVEAGIIEHRQDVGGTLQIE